MRVLLTALAMLALSAAPALADPLRAGAEAVRDHALTDTTAYDYVEQLSVESRLAVSIPCAARCPKRVVFAYSASTCKG